MASIFSHAVAALGIGAGFYRPGTPNRVWVAGAACSVIPDLDVIGFRFGIHYDDFWGHRGFAHSLLFAALLASATVFIGFRRGLPSLGRLPMGIYFFLATASHGLLDAMTDGGLGVAFFWPLDNHRYFLPWTPSGCRRSVSGDSSRIAVLPSSRARSSGFGFPRPCL